MLNWEQITADVNESKAYIGWMGTAEKQGTSENQATFSDDLAHPAVLHTSQTGIPFSV